MHLSRQQKCWPLRHTRSIARRRCSNYVFILDLTPVLFNGLGRDDCKTGRKTYMCEDLVPYTRGLTISSQIATLLSHLWIISVDHVASSNKIYRIMYDLLWTAMFATSEAIHSWSSQGKKVSGESLHERPNRYLWTICHKIYHFWHALSCFEHTNQVNKYRLPCSSLSLKATCSNMALHHQHRIGTRRL